MEYINVECPLTGREYEVMELVSIGKDNKEIAKKLYVEESTIKKHLQNIFPKLRVRNRIQATLKFMELCRNMEKPSGHDPDSLFHHQP